MPSAIERRLSGSLRSAVITELFTNTIHFPIANIILELLKSGIGEYIGELDMYVILFCCLVQAYFLGKWNHSGKKRRFIGNMIGPLLYIVIEVPLEGMQFFNSYNHLAYPAFGFLIGMLQQIQDYSVFRLKAVLMVLENLIRTYIVLVMYIIYEITQPDAPEWSEFITDESHVYFATVITLLGLVIGFANITSYRYLTILRDTAKVMKTFSEWFLGGRILSDALEDNQALRLKREERTVIFTDIRGFTSWSEARTPEEVVGMLNTYFEIPQECWTDDNIIKIKYTGDEIMAVCKDKAKALGDAVKVSDLLSEYLREFGLSAGTGVHSGLLVEGMIGSDAVKAYDVIGDTVNTAKRICDKAKGGEVLVSDSTLQGVGDVNVLERLEITAKGKADSITVCRIK